MHPACLLPLLLAPLLASSTALASPLERDTVTSMFALFEQKVDRVLQRINGLAPSPPPPVSHSPGNYDLYPDSTVLVGNEWEWKIDVSWTSGSSVAACCTTSPTTIITQASGPECCG
jgi:hypothetical protein